MTYSADQVPDALRRAFLGQVSAGSLVLDVGCWTGYYGKYLMESRACVVHGIERDPAAAGVAAKHYAWVSVQDLNHQLEVSYPYDAILLMDVLEHVEDPVGLVDRVKVVVPDAVLFVSIPNVAHWSVRVNLLRGKWDYSDTGILDRTHLRFFTCNEAVKLVEQAGYRIRSTYYSGGHLPLIGARYPQLMSLLARWRPSLFAVQVLMVAEPICGIST